MKTLHAMDKSFRCLIIGGLSLLLLIAQPVRADEYGYEKKDKQVEQAKYLAKLSEDNRKVELAILNTKALIHKARNKPYLPELYLRLAELYIEQSRIVYYVRRTEKGDAASAFDQMEANALKNQALEIYLRILNDFPDFEARDKVHFFMAHEYRELNQIDEMVVQYRTIITKYPSSPYVPESYLLLGDYFISKQDLDTAKKHYEAILKFPDCTAISIARYKLGWCYINELQFREAIRLFEDVVQGSGKGKELEIDTYKRVDIKQEALMDMAYCYTECYKDNPPEEALAYFQKYSWSRQVYTAVLEKLANRYYIKKKWSHAVVVYRQLSMLEQESTKLLEYARNIFECVQTLGTFEHADQDVALIVKALRKEKYSTHVPDEQKIKDQSDFELYARNIVTYLHDDARQKDAIEGFERAADAYKIYLDFFETSTVYTEMSENYAEALFSSRQYLKAGKQYEALAMRMAPNDTGKEEKLYGAVISYYNALKEKEKLNYFETAFAREGLKTTGKLYAADFPGSSKVPDVEFNVAWVTYDAGDYDDAIKEFTSYVKAHPGNKATKAAVHMVLDSYSLKEDYEGLIAFGNGILKNTDIADQQLKSEVAVILQSTENKVISSLTVAALDDWEKGKSELIQYASRSESSGIGEQALSAVILSSKEKGDIKTLLTTGADLVSRYPSSPKVEGTLNTMIDSSLRMAQFRLVADYLESFALRLPDHKNTRDFLLQAGHIRKDLGQYELSSKDYQRLMGMKSRNSATLDEVVFALAENAQKVGDMETVIRVLTDNRNGLTEAGRVRADARSAALYIDAGEFREAEPLLRRAEKAYPKMAALDDHRLQGDMAHMVYSETFRVQDEFMGLQLKGELDNAVVAEKAKLLDRLEKGYQTVMLYKSPEWALKALYQSSAINSEFASFLKEAPIPAELTPEQKDQYAQIIQTKAAAYQDKADQYLQTCIQQGRKWEVCDPELAEFFNPPSAAEGNPRKHDSFSGSTASVEIGGQCLLDQDLKGLHEHLLKGKPDPNMFISLCLAYMQRGDYRHAILIAQKALDEKKALGPVEQASLYNCLGVARLQAGDDGLARDAFKEAIAIDATNVEARINLAGLLKHYGHDEKAIQLYQGLPAAAEVEKGSYNIHPKAKELYHASTQISKN
ncbi:MAG: tetratricopeptide repeat protein [Desulfobacterota bacterium]|nr:tetratricopeptide repeat protein [Thermodesulfobacteriota bacterium]